MLLVRGNIPVGGLLGASWNLLGPSSKPLADIPDYRREVKPDEVRRFVDDVLFSKAGSGDIPPVIHHRGW